MRAKKKKPNPGWFRKGADARRHQLTREERQLGYRVLMNGGRGGKPGWKIAWAWRKVRKYYQRAAELDQVHGEIPF